MVKRLGGPASWFRKRLRKCGSILGNNTEIGCNSVLCPGTIVGENSSVYPLTMVKGEVESNMIVKSTYEIVKKK